MKNRYKIIVSYDGTNYWGWQSQRNGKTVAEALEKAFFDAFKLAASYWGVSRTDAGVHALGQVVSIKTNLDIPLDKILFAWNSKLPADIVVRSIVKIDLDFKLYAGIVEKTYYYHFFTKQPQPFIARYGWVCPYKIDFDKLKQCLQVFVGTHDFRSYCTGNDWEDTVRTIDSITLEYLDQHDMYRIAVKGPRFLRYMIRRIVGACIQVASNSKVDVERLVEVMQQKDPNQALLNAPPRGLMLYNIRYKKDEYNEQAVAFKIF
jgi:tRNA pseudouridine38-40 synthase